jgi:hypothetical protein
MTFGKKLSSQLLKTKNADHSFYWSRKDEELSVALNGRIRDQK